MIDESLVVPDRIVVSMQLAKTLTEVVVKDRRGLDERARLVFLRGLIERTNVIELVRRSEVFEGGLSLRFAKRWI